MSFLIFPIESSLYVKKGMQKIIDNRKYHDWYPTLFFGKETNPLEIRNNPNDVFIQIEDNRYYPKNNKKFKRNVDPNKHRIYIQTFQWTEREKFMKKLEDFAKFCKSKKITIFGMIYAFIGDEMDNICVKNDSIKIVIKKGQVIESQINIIPRQIYGWEGKTNKDESLYALYHRQIEGDSRSLGERFRQKLRKSGIVTPFDYSSDSFDDNDSSSSLESSITTSPFTTDDDTPPPPPNSSHQNSKKSHQNSKGSSQNSNKNSLTIDDALKYIQKHSQSQKKNSQQRNQIYNFDESSSEEEQNSKKSSKKNSQKTVTYEITESPKKKFDSDDDAFLNLLK